MTVACAALTLTALAGDTKSTWALSPLPEGPRLAYTALNALKPWGFSVRTLGVEGSRQVVLARGSQRGVVPNPFSTVSWSADGAWLAFAGSKGSRKGIHRLRADGTGLRFLRGTKGGRNPVFSLDGSKIAFVRSRFGAGFSLETAIWVANADGRATFQLTPWRENVEYLPSSFSPDASALAVTSSDFRSGKSSVLLFGLDRSRRVGVLARRASEAVFSPDGSQIALVRHTVVRRGKSLTVVNKDLYVMSVDGTASKAVTRTHLIAETRPSWDPSEQRITFNSFRMSKDPIEALFDELLPVGNSIAQVNADGSCRQKIISLRGAALYGPVWRPGLDRAAGRIEC